MVDNDSMAQDDVMSPNCSQRNRVPAAGTGKPRCAKCQTWLPWIVDADDRDYDAVVANSPVPVLLNGLRMWLDDTLPTA